MPRGIGRYGKLISELRLGLLLCGTISTWLKFISRTIGGARISRILSLLVGFRCF